MNLLRTRPASLALLVFVGALLLTGLFVALLQNDHRRQQQSLLREQLSGLRARLENEINAAMFLVRGLELEVSIHDDISADDFMLYARELTNRSPFVRNVALAPDNVVQRVYPLEGNERVLGLRYLEDVPAQRESVLTAIRSAKPKLFGPLNLVQGGVGVIHRAPIFTNRGEQPRYWGLVSVVLDFDRLLAHAGIVPTPEVALGMRGRDGTGNSGEVFWGGPEAFSQPDVVVPVQIPGGEWALAGRFITFSSSAFAAVAGLVGLLLSAVLALLVYRAALASARARELALHDPLTDLPNRRLLDMRLEHAIERAQREQARLAVLCIDLDEFKPVNDRFGHDAGDDVLRQTADRLRKQLRAHDTLARIGGDEFLLLLDPIDSAQTAERVAEKLLESLTPTFVVNQQPIRLGLSIGIAVYPENGSSKQALLRAADQAMYRAKHGGKNRAVAWQASFALVSDTAPANA